ncbi:MAG: universal stress protein [Nitriliruptoraceae bacterium]
MEEDLRTPTQRPARIVVGVDQSPGSRSALAWAAGVARLLNLRLRVIQAWQYPSDAIVRVGYVHLTDAEHSEDRLAADLQRFVREVVGEPSGLKIRIEEARGPTTEALLRAASEPNTAMLVVGSRGLGGFRGLLLGSVSRQLCEHAPCPVTVVRGEIASDQVRLKTLVVGLDGSEQASRALAFAGDLAEQTGSRVVVAHAAERGTSIEASEFHLTPVATGVQEEVERWCAQLHQRGVDHDVAIKHGDPRTVLRQVVAEHDADLLIVGSHGATTVAHLMLGSVASSLARHCEVPVTIVPHVSRR